MITGTLVIQLRFWYHPVKNAFCEGLAVIAFVCLCDSPELQSGTTGPFYINFIDIARQPYLEISPT